MAPCTQTSDSSPPALPAPADRRSHCQKVTSGIVLLATTGVAARRRRSTGARRLKGLVQALTGLTSEVLLVGNSTTISALPRLDGARFVCDQRATTLSPAAVAAALTAARRPYCLLLAAMAPSPDHELLAYLLAVAVDSDADATVPRWDGRRLPLPAVYRDRCATVAARCSGDLGELLLNLRLHEISESDLNRFAGAAGSLGAAPGARARNPR